MTAVELKILTQFKTDWLHGNSLLLHLFCYKSAKGQNNYQTSSEFVRTKLTFADKSNSIWSRNTMKN